MNDFNQYTEHSSWYFSIEGFFFSFVNYYTKIFIAFLQQYVTKGFVYYIHLDRSVTTFRNFLDSQKGALATGNQILATAKGIPNICHGDRKTSKSQQ